MFFFKTAFPFLIFVVSNPKTMTNICNSLTETKESKKRKFTYTDRVKINYDLTEGERLTPEYRAWCAMRSRCNNKRSDTYKYYGAVGITVCDEWLSSFRKFLTDMGPRPSPKHSVDRIDVHGNYEPSNCKWSTSKEQMRNRRTNKLISFNGETKTMAEWCDITGLGKHIIYKRLRRGWSVKDALETPIQQHKSHKKINLFPELT